MKIYFSFEQYVSLFSLGIALLSLIITVVVSFISHKSSAKILIKEQQVQCYCNLAFALLKIREEGLTEDNLHSFTLFSSQALLVGDDKVIDQVTYCTDKVSEKDLSSEDIAQTFEILKNSIRNRSVFSAF